MLCLACAFLLTQYAPHFDLVERRNGELRIQGCNLQPESQRPVRLELWSGEINPVEQKWFPSLDELHAALSENTSPTKLVAEGELHEDCTLPLPKESQGSFTLLAIHRTEHEAVLWSQARDQWIVYISTDVTDTIRTGQPIKESHHNGVWYPILFFLGGFALLATIAAIAYASHWLVGIYLKRAQRSRQVSQ